jgi:hypothetical protein
MNWEIAVAVAEIAGAIAVVVTLLYLTFQLRQNNNLASGAAQRELMTGFQENLDRIRSAPKLFQHGLRDFENLPNVDQLEFQMIFNHFVDHLEVVLRMAERGLETQDNVNIYGDICLAFLQEPGGMKIWEKCKPLFFTLSREYVEGRLADKSTLPPRIGDSMAWWTPDMPVEKNT